MTKHALYISTIFSALCASFPAYSDFKKGILNFAPRFQLATVSLLQDEEVEDKNVSPEEAVVSASNLLIKPDRIGEDERFSHNCKELLGSTDHILISVEDVTFKEANEHNYQVNQGTDVLFEYRYSPSTGNFRQISTNGLQPNCYISISPGRFALGRSVTMRAVFETKLLDPGTYHIELLEETRNSKEEMVIINLTVE